MSRALLAHRNRGFLDDPAHPITPRLVPGAPPEGIPRGFDTAPPDGEPLSALLSRNDDLNRTLQSSLRALQTSLTPGAGEPALDERTALLVRLRLLSEGIAAPEGLVGDPTPHPVSLCSFGCAERRVELTGAPAAGRAVVCAV
jgi:hypothetical protein